MRVIAIRSFKDGVVEKFGEGEYIGDKVPNEEPFNDLGLKNPCIKLDSGKYVWGFQCWWAPLESFNKKYSEKIKEVVNVEPKNIKPVE